MHIGIGVGFLILIGVVLAWMGIVYLTKKRITPKSIWDETATELLEVGQLEGPYRNLYGQMVRFQYANISNDFGQGETQELTAKVVGQKGKLVAYFEEGRLTSWNNGKESCSSNGLWFFMPVHQAKVDCLESTLGRVQAAVLLCEKKEERARAKT